MTIEDKLLEALYWLANDYHTGANAADRARNDVRKALETVELPYIPRFSETKLTEEERTIINEAIEGLCCDYSERLIRLLNSGHLETSIEVSRCRDNLRAIDNLFIKLDNKSLDNE